MILQLGGPGLPFQQILLRGTTVAMRPTAAGNRMTVACTSMPSGQNELIFGVNGTVVADTTVSVVKTFWAPMLYLNGEAGSATATYTNIVQSAW